MFDWSYNFGPVRKYALISLLYWLIGKLCIGPPLVQLYNWLLIRLFNPILTNIILATKQGHSSLPRPDFGTTRS